MIANDRYPHVHDHCTALRLVSNKNGTITNIVPANSLSHPVEHDAVCGSPNVPWHVHGSGSGHLPVGGLSPWVPSSPVTVAAAEMLRVEGDFDNPHGFIDNMLVYILYWK